MPSPKDLPESVWQSLSTVGYYFNLSNEDVVEGIRYMQSRPSDEGWFEIMVDKLVRYYKVDREALLSKGKRKSVAEARMIAYYVARRVSGMSWPELGRQFGNRDHSTILSGAKRGYQVLLTKPDVAKLFETELDGKLIPIDGGGNGAAV